MTEKLPTDPLAEALTWIEDVEPDGDEDVGQTGWYRTGRFFVPAPTDEFADTVEYINQVKVADFVLWAREEIVRLRASHDASAPPLAGSDESVDLSRTRDALWT